MRTIPEECRFHNHPYTERIYRGVRCKCKSCLRSKHDSDKSNKITNNHVVGVFCKEWTQCRICSRIKYIIRVLKHYSGIKHSKRKCDICKWYDSLHIVERFPHTANKKNLVRELYILMLKR